MLKSPTSKKCSDELILAGGKRAHRGLRAELERNGRLLIEELRRKRYSLSAQRHLELGLVRLFHHLKEIKVQELAAVREEHLVSYARKLQCEKTPRGVVLALSTQGLYLQMARGFFSFLYRRGLLLDNPAAELRIPAYARYPLVLSEREASRLMGAPSPSSWEGKRDRALLETLYGTGIRRGECVRLDVSDVDLQQGRLLVRDGKGRKDRLVPLVGRAAAALDVYLRKVRPEVLEDPRENALFLTWYHRSSRRIGKEMLRVTVRKHAQAVGIDRIHVHALRYSCATHLLRRGADVRYVQELLGHRRLRTTALYAQVTHRDLLDVIERCHPRARGGWKK